MFQPSLSLPILIVDDNAINRDLILRVLRRAGYNADVVEDGIQALQALEKQPYAIVLMDVQMPGIDGLETTRRIRRQFPAERQPRIIAVTASEELSEFHACRDAGMDDFISKPIDRKQFIALIQRYVPAESVLAPSVATTPAAAPIPQSEGGDLKPAGLAVLSDDALVRLRVMLGSQAEALVPTLISVFLKDSQTLQTTAREALACHELNQFQRAMHTLKSNSMLFGATHLANLCCDLEHRARDGVMAGAEELFIRVEQELIQVRAALEKLVL